MDNNIEKELIEKGLTAPRITPQTINATVVDTQFHIFAGTTTTVCLLTLVNGFTVLGESACASPDNFDEEIGKKIAYENAINKVWPLEGYLLKEKLFKQQQSEK